MSQNQEYKYVEGIAVCKTSGVAICHAWNIDKNERAIDVTYADTDNYDYYGIEIPFECTSSKKLDIIVWSNLQKNC